MRAVKVSFRHQKARSAPEGQERSDQGLDIGKDGSDTRGEFLGSQKHATESDSGEAQPYQRVGRDNREIHPQRA